MIFNKNDIVYCDANFLVAYAAKKIKQPEIKKRANILIAKLLISGCKIVASSLTFDETWLGIKRELGPKTILNATRFYISKILEKVGLKLKNHGASEFSYFEIFEDLKFFTNKLLIHQRFSVVQFQDSANGVKNALMNLYDFNLKPRDSFHLAIMKDNRATYFISNDGDFTKNKKSIGVNVINF